MTVAEFIKGMNELIAVNPQWADSELTLCSGISITTYGYGGFDNTVMMLTKGDLNESTDDTPQ
jgi:hypothetical protein